jgi:hemerythrin superfamily protein
MPDPIQMLTQDHREAEDLFEEYRSHPNPELVERICTELTVHTAVEEKIVYPVLGQRVDGGDDMRRHSEEEHGKVRRAILEIERVGLESLEVDRLMQEIMEGVTHHVDEEEGEVFPAMRSELSEDQLLDVGEKAQATKQQLMAEAEEAGPLIDLSKDELSELAKARGIEHRSDMTKHELVSALRSA